MENYGRPRESTDDNMIERRINDVCVPNNKKIVNTLTIFATLFSTATMVTGACLTVTSHVRGLPCLF